MRVADIVAHSAHFIGGEWVTSSREPIDVFNPASGEIVGHVQNGGKAEAELAIAAASEARHAWAAMTASERAGYLHRWAALIRAHQEEIAHLLTREQGKPLAESREEAEGAAMFIEWYAEEGKRAYGEMIPALARNKRIFVVPQPVGVAALITPWNYPATMVARKAAPALAAGCTIVLKPASQTPLTAVALIALAAEAGFPSGVVNLVTGKSSEIGAAFMRHPRVRKVSFTGSTEVGKLLIRQSADEVTRLSLELGGNAPFIVFPDADLDAAVAAAVGNKFENCGQMCNGINVMYVHEDVLEAFSAQVTERVSTLKVGFGWEAGVQLGPVIDHRAVEFIDALVREAVRDGAKVRIGGGALTKTPYQNGSFYAPTVLTDVTPEMRIAQEEVFGPVATIIGFKTEDEVLERANASEFGLAAYLFTRDVRRVFEVSERLEVGMVGVNSASLSVPQAPFGGIKQSGYGREGGHHGLEEFMEMKYISLTL
ncbi:NAD-dependent succinate-semialdehyde dehydrogenase [Alicyclobacillus cycloheptanicus]|uniref:Succinate-semialdehyde dehydrogenase/glutarate-semialdehyde dehydrogenase n=1 Tax=Alicyclobacillus cycloheptanicus TaxID=1457 RepID=A0ABT9XHJ1_9BACL|nr:NAD-dependent succinate-semialdehyde dehydrogenase [Alicyclobacillus cycloheptanicus]MDQ0189499.1 succinate-semialdehyde dehydrogenase/glutarate-semialdehyde dehydrogenase [Alicyclobacillus cycloheptanicus]